jgi:hypothetical protein
MRLYDHLLAMGQTHGIGRQRVNELIELLMRHAGPGARPRSRVISRSTRLPIAGSLCRVAVLPLVAILRLALSDEGE